MSNGRGFNRHAGFSPPPSVDEWLPGKHLARFVAEIIDGLDLSAMSSCYRGSGSGGLEPRLPLGILACHGRVLQSRVEAGGPSFALIYFLAFRNRV